MKRSGTHWVRKRVLVDERKLRLARQLLGVETDVEAIDAALDVIAFRRELEQGFAAVRRSGGIDELFERGR